MEEHDRGFGFGPNAEAGPSSPRSNARSHSLYSPSRSRLASGSASAGERPTSFSPPVTPPRSSSPLLSVSEYNSADADRDYAAEISAEESDDESDLNDIGNPDGDEPQGLRWYISDLGRHIKSSLGALEGRLTTKDDATHNNFTYTDLVASTLSPSNTLWTPAEKSLFFASLARHSRHRADLIAADVRTKTEAQVHEYLSALRWEASKTSDRKGEGEESKTWRNHLLWTGAYEVSEAFTKREGVLAETIEARATTLVPDRKRKRRELNDSEQLEEWGRDLDVEKLYTLSALLRDSERRDIGDLEEIGIQVSSDVEHDTEDPIAKDNEEITTLQAIGKKDRTPAQKTLLRTLLNRKAARERSRIKTLQKLGFTPAQISAGGGPDAMYAAHLANDRPKKKKGARRKSLAEVKTADGDVQRLAALGADAFLTERGWEVLNYSRVAQLMGASGRMYDTLPSARLDFDDEHNGPKEEPAPLQQSDTVSTNKTSFPVVSDLYTELLAYLKPLVYASVLVAEQQIPQTGGRHVTVEHVIAALGLRGELGTLREISNESREERSRSLGISGTESTPVPEACGDAPYSPSRPTTPEPPATDSAQDPAPTEVRGPHLSRTPATDAISWTVASAAPLLDRYDSEESDSASDMDVDLEGDDVLVNGGMTDIEDEELDAALHTVDRRLDAVMRAQLSGALKDDDPSIPVDEWIWSRPLGRTLKRRARDVDDDLVLALDGAQERYCETVQRVSNARRARSKAVARTELFPRTRQIRKTMSRLDPHPWKNSRMARAQAAKVKRERGERGESLEPESRDVQEESDGGVAEDEWDENQEDEDEEEADEEQDEQDELDSDRAASEVDELDDSEADEDSRPKLKRSKPNASKPGPSTADSSRQPTSESSRQTSRRTSGSRGSSSEQSSRELSLPLKQSQRSNADHLAEIKQSQRSNPGHFPELKQSQHSNPNSAVEIKQSQHSNPGNPADVGDESLTPEADREDEDEEEEQDELNSDSDTNMKREFRSDPARPSSPIVFQSGWSRTPEDDETEDIKPAIPSSDPVDDGPQAEVELELPDDDGDDQVDDDDEVIDEDHETETQDHVLDTQHSAREVDEIQEESLPRSRSRSLSSSASRSRPPSRRSSSEYDWDD